MLSCFIVACLVAASGETTVSQRRPADVDDARLLLQTGLAPAAPEEALLSVPGVALAREGGPLSPSRPVVRGLSGSRLDVSVLGLPFSDPAAGAVDAGLLPWVLGTVDVDVGAGAGLGGSIAVQRPGPGIAASVVAGELSTLLVQGRAVQETDGALPSTVGVAGSVGTSRGDFVFRAGDALGNTAPLLRRFNNQQQRGSAAVFGLTRIDDVTLRGAGVVAVHEGGIPGFSTAPFQTLRGRRALGSAGLGLTWRGPVVVDVAGSVQGSERSTTLGSFHDDDVSTLFGSRIAARGSTRGIVAPGWSVEGGVDVVGAEIPAVVQRREGALFGAVRGRSALGPVVARLDVDAAVRAVDDTEGGDDDDDDGAVLPTGALRLGVSDRRSRLLGFVGVAWAARMPTLDERFAPQGFVLGNAQLLPETATEVEVGVVVAVDAVAVRAVAHASVVDDAIVLVNRSAFAVIAENTGPATRAGIDLGATFAPTRTVSFDVAASMLASEVEATHAPLPGAPPMLLRLRSRVGDEALHVDVATQSRGASSSNIFGTLRSPGFTFVDVAVRLPLSDNLGLGLSLSNVFNVLDARDTNLLPLPGRLFFVSLEVKA